MTLGSGDPTPYDLYALVALCLLALVLLTGAIVGSNWVSDLAPLLRRGAALLALVVMAAVFFLTPTTNGIVGAGRLLTLWPAFAACVVFFLIWSWRSGRL